MKLIVKYTMSESIDVLIDDNQEDKSNKSDFVTMGGSLLWQINFKVGLYLLIIGMVLFSDIFIDGVLYKIDGTTHGECTTTKGTMIQLILFILAYLVLDILVKNDCI